MTEEYSDSSSLNFSFYLPILIGLMGAVLGVVGIVMAIQAGNEAKVAAEAVGDRTRLAEQFSEQVDAINDRLDTLSRRLVETSTRETGEQIVARVMEQVRPATQNLDRRLQASDATLAGVVSSLESLNRNLEVLDQRTTEMAGRLGGGRTTTTTSTTSSTSGGTDTRTSAPTDVTELPVDGDTGQRVYRIRPGDNFTRLSQRFGVSVGAITRANPEVDPNRLQIDQEIIIPAP